MSEMMVVSPSAADIPIKRIRRKLPVVSQLSLFLAARMMDLGINQGRAAALCNLDQGLLCKLMSGKIASTGMENLLRIAIGLRCTPEKVFAAAGRPELGQLLDRAFREREVA